jgi:alkylhydroperoxidase/carboxymuconolactone decarboxylase family protein YurZ
MTDKTASQQTELFEKGLAVRRALNNGITREEISKTFLQAAIYCGVPAAPESFKNALEIFKEEDTSVNGKDGGVHG